MGSSQKLSKGKRQERARKGKDRDIPDILIVHRDRLHEALRLGIRFDNEGERKWLSTDALTSSHAVRMMSGFIDHMSLNLMNHPMVKDSVVDMLVALEGILQIKNETVLGIAVTTTTKLLECLGSSISQYQLSGVVFHLLKLLSSHSSAIVFSSAKSLNYILRSIDCSRHVKKKVWCILEETNAIARIIHSLQDYDAGVRPIEHIVELVLILKEIAWRWPVARYSVWSSPKVMEKLGQLSTTLDASVTSGILQLYCAIANCGDVAKGFMESQQPFLSNLLSWMASSVPLAIRVEAFRLCQQLVRSEEVCLLLTTLCGEEIVISIVDAMGGWRLASPASISLSQSSLVKEACYAAHMTCWIGKHHGYFWKHGIDKVLYDLLLGHDGKIDILKGSSLIKELREELQRKFPEINNSIWTILGWLSMNCEEELHPNHATDLHCLNVLISCACSITGDWILRERHSRDSTCLPVVRATLWMVFSPCRYIASRARCSLSEMLKHDDFRHYLRSTLDFFSTYTVENYTPGYDNWILLRLISLACYSSLSEYQSDFFRNGGLITLVTMLKACLEISGNKSTVASSTYSCCSTAGDDREFEHTFLLYILQTLSQLSHLSGPMVSDAKHDGDYRKSLYESLLFILDNNFSYAVKWYAAYCLSFFGFYGFPSRFGRRMKAAFDDPESKDSELTLSNKEVVGVHRIILMFRCPSLLSPADSIKDGNPTHASSEKLLSTKCLSSHVKRSTLENLLEFVYTGFFKVEENDVRPLRILAKSCGLDSLHRMLQQKLPLCTSSLPSCDLTSALTPLGRVLSDVILEARETDSDWSCQSCQLLIPHVHAHKIILCMHSEYLHALFRSGMQESSSEIIKVPLSWNALVKLLHWFYSGELPGIKFTCAWMHLNDDTQLHELLVYFEISELAKLWCLDEVGEKSIQIIMSCIKLNKNFPIKIVQVAYNLREEEILKVAMKQLAPSYIWLHDSGELEEFEEELIEMLRKVHVAHSLEDHEVGN